MRSKELTLEITKPIGSFASRTSSSFRDSNSPIGYGLHYCFLLLKEEVFVNRINWSKNVAR
jgi:hypothetical protein